MEMTASSSRGDQQYKQGEAESRQGGGGCNLMLMPRCRKQIERGRSPDVCKQSNPQGSSLSRSPPPPSSPHQAQRRPHLVLLRSLLDGHHRVDPVSLGLSANQADGGLILLTEEFQSFPVLLAQPLPPCPSFGCLQAQPLGYLDYFCQLPVGSQVSLRGCLFALRAGEILLGFLPATGDARPAEVVPAMDGDGVLEEAQADGAGGFIAETFSRAVCSHGLGSDDDGAAFVFRSGWSCPLAAPLPAGVSGPEGGESE